MKNRRRLLKGSLISGGTVGVAVPTALLFMERDQRDGYQQTKAEEEAKLVSYQSELEEKTQKLQKLQYVRGEELAGMEAAGDAVGQLAEEKLGIKKGQTTDQSESGESAGTGSVEA